MFGVVAVAGDEGVAPVDGPAVGLADVKLVLGVAAEAPAAAAAEIVVDVGVDEEERIETGDWLVVESVGDEVCFEKRPDGVLVVEGVKLECDSGVTEVSYLR